MQSKRTTQTARSACHCSQERHTAPRPTAQANRQLLQTPKCPGSWHLRRLQRAMLLCTLAVCCVHVSCSPKPTMPSPQRSACTSCRRLRRQHRTRSKWWFPRAAGRTKRCGPQRPTATMSSTSHSHRRCRPRLPPWPCRHLQASAARPRRRTRGWATCSARSRMTRSRRSTPLSGQSAASATQCGRRFGSSLSRAGRVY